MALNDLYGWNNTASVPNSACGAADKPAERPAACGSACGAADRPAETPADKPEEKPAACGSACGAGDQQ